MASVVLNEANEYFLPFQCVSAKGGTEAVVHTWRSLLEEFDGLDLIGFKIDFDNAFNEVQRAVFLKESYEKFPLLFQSEFFIFW